MKQPAKTITGVLVLITLLFTACQKDGETEPSIQVSDFTVTIDENPVNGAVLGQIEFSTLNDSVNIIIKSQSPEGALAIHSKTGTLTVADVAKFDFETSPKLIALVELQSKADTTEANITVNLNDVTEWFNIEDDNFKNILINHNPVIDTNGDKIITAAEVEVVKELYIDDSNINSLAGLKHFKNLTKLVCKDNNLINLDVSYNSQLRILICSDNNLQTLELGQITSLKQLTCNENELKAIDVSKNPGLILLECNENLLTSLDLSQNTKLRRVECYDNKLTHANLKNGNNTNLVYVDLRYNSRNLCVKVDNPEEAFDRIGWYMDWGVRPVSECN